MMADLKDEISVTRGHRRISLDVVRQVLREVPTIRTGSTHASSAACRRATACTVPVGRLPVAVPESEYVAVGRG